MVRTHRAQQGGSVSRRAPARVEISGIALPEPMTSEEVRSDNDEYLATLAEVLGPEAAAQALDAYVHRVETAARETAERDSPRNLVRVTRDG